MVYLVESITGDLYHVRRAILISTAPRASWLTRWCSTIKTEGHPKIGVVGEAPLDIGIFNLDDKTITQLSQHYSDLNVA
ncbi:hypothetical protein RchiOBHm_Chr6g0292691 [Rosa chinensis]|uniref:Uncharacterized protein n=1 Tax=Rosa chinensis TaxID=74649 RepID=A0A2P6PWG2_ROSCH|nr:hypothetical protein RchiOBHm_Chr6g0292691 [Rosa chinensis]